MFSGNGIIINDWENINDLFCTVILQSNKKAKQFFGPFESKHLISKICFSTKDYILNCTYEGEKKLELEFQFDKCEEKKDISLLDKIQYKYDPFYNGYGGYGYIVVYMFCALLGLYIIIFWLKFGYAFFKYCRCCRCETD